MSGTESSSLLVKDKASLDNSAQFFLFKGKFNYAGFHCSVVASKYFFFFAWAVIWMLEISCFTNQKPSAVSDASLQLFSCVVVNGASPSFLGTTGSCPLWSGLIPYIISCHLSKPIYKMSADPGIQAKLSFHEKTNSLEMHFCQARISELLKKTWSIFENHNESWDLMGWRM